MISAMMFLMANCCFILSGYCVVDSSYIPRLSEETLFLKASDFIRSGSARKVRWQIISETYIREVEPERWHQLVTLNVYRLLHRI